LQQVLETFPVIADGEYIVKNFAIRAEDKAIMLIFGHVNSDTDHNDTSQKVNVDAEFRRTLCSCNLVQHKPSGSI
jgi:hypothetical protein